jgi:hypothetical protein
LASAPGGLSDILGAMHPSFGVPWPRLQRAAARLNELNAAPAHCSGVHALLFLCGLKYLLTYRQETRRRLTHYLDDGLREAVQRTLPVLMKRSTDAPWNPSPRFRRHDNAEFQQLVFGFKSLLKKLPAGAARWLENERREENFLRLSFGMGVVSRFAPESHQFVRRMLEKPLFVGTPTLDVLESFRWDPKWSLVLAR